VTERRFVLSWVAVSAVTEVIAVCVALLVPAVTWGTVVLVVLLEGLLLGFGQRWILRSVRPGLESSWIAATMAGALLGRCVQFAADTGPYAAIVFEWNIAAQAGIGAALGALVGGIMALPQAVVLKNRVDRPVSWVAARALAWCIALPLLMLAGGGLAAVSSAGPSIVILALFATFGAVAAFVGSIEGVVFERLLHKRPVVTRSKIAASIP
jgi:hypothetical protein